LRDFDEITSQNLSPICPTFDTFNLSRHYTAPQNTLGYIETGFLETNWFLNRMIYRVPTGSGTLFLCLGTELAILNYRVEKK